MTHLPPETLAAATPYPPETTPMEDNKLIERELVNRLRLLASTRVSDMTATEFRQACRQAADTIEALSPSNTRSSQEVERVIRPADGTSLPRSDGWRIVRSIDPEGPDPKLLWERIPLASNHDAEIERLTAYYQSKLAERYRLERDQAFVRGAQACREMMARFVEQGGDTGTAASIRANWCPSWDTVVWPISDEVYGLTDPTPTPQIDERAAENPNRELIEREARELLAQAYEAGGHKPGDWLRDPSIPTESLRGGERTAIIAIVTALVRGEHTTALPTVPVDGLVEALKPFARAADIYSETIRTFTGATPGTLTEQRFIDGERRETAEEAMSEYLAGLSFETVDAARAAIAALSRTMGGGSGGCDEPGQGGGS